MKHKPWAEVMFVLGMFSLPIDSNTTKGFVVEELRARVRVFGESAVFSIETSNGRLLYREVTLGSQE